MRPYFFFILPLMMLCASQPAECGIVDDAKIVKFVSDLFDQEYWDGDWTIADKHGKPAKKVKSSGHIRAWIDIIGFENESLIDGTRYVNGSAKDFAIVKRDVWHTQVDGVVVSFTTTYNIVDRINTTIATQHTTLHWKYKVYTAFGFYWVHVWEHLTISHAAESPEIFTTRIPDVHVHITSHNRSVNPITYIYIPIENDTSMEDVMISRVCYNGSNIARYDQTGWVMENQKGTEYVEFVDDGTLPTWVKDDNQSSIDHCGRFVTVFGRDFNQSLLNISLHTPYETRYVTNYTVDDVEGNAKVNVPMLKIILLIVGSVVAFILVIGVVRRSI